MLARAALAGLAGLSAIATRADPPGQVTVLQYNVGNAAVGCFSNGDVPVDDMRLSKAADIRSVREFLSVVRPDVILLQETLSGTVQLLDPANPVLPAGYAARCPAIGARGNGMVCIAWNTERARMPSPDSCVGRFSVTRDNVPSENPDDYVELDEAIAATLPSGGPLTHPLVKGGLVRCELEVDQKRVQFVSTYVPNLGLRVNSAIKYYPKPARAREMVLDWIWHDSTLVNPALPAIVGGDFNTDWCTGQHAGDCTLPYPTEFGTLFGFHKAGYGRWAPPGETEADFQGAYSIDGEAQWIASQHFEYCGLRIRHSYLDHVFANFGEPAGFDGDPRRPEKRGDGPNTYPCRGSACAWDGQRTGGEFPPICPTCDHKPVLTGVRW